MVFGIGFALTALATTELQHALVVVGWTLGEIGVAAVIGAILTNRAPVALRARYLSLIGMEFALGAVIGPPLGGVILQTYGSTAVWLGCGLVAIVGAGILWVSISARTASPAEFR